METAQYRQELAVVSDDLMAMTKEQQVVNGELLRATSERDKAWSELREAKAAQQAAEANAKAKQKEVDDVVKAYQELGVENRRVVADMDDIERDLRRAKAALDSSDAMLAQVTERAKSAEAENRAYASDLQAYQRQVDNLTHLLENSARDKGDEVGSCEALTTKLEASKAMLFDMERAREMSRRETAAAEANLLVTRSRLTDAQGDNETLKHKLRLETNRVRELESLVSALRTHEHQAIVESGDSSQRSELLRERVSALQEQNHGLSCQLEALKQDRKSFETEIERLRSVIEDVAAGGATPSHSGRTATSALVHAEAKAKESEHEVERLASSLKEAQKKCEILETKVRETELTANNARAEALTIARREAEARAELGGLRSELSIAKEALREAMEDGCSTNDSQVLHMRVRDAERRAAAAESTIASMERAKPVYEASAEEVNVLREENQRLLNLLSKANNDLNSARKIIDEQGYADGATALLVNERVQAAEEARRRVEQDYQRLAEQMHQMESAASGELSDRLRELEEVNAELEYENDALRESLAGTEEAIAVMQQDLARTVGEYAKLGSLVETMSDDSDA
jgi:centrosomal protein CEP135